MKNIKKYFIAFKIFYRKVNYNLKYMMYKMYVMV